MDRYYVVNRGLSCSTVVVSIVHRQWRPLVVTATTTGAIIAGDVPSAQATHLSWTQVSRCHPALLCDANNPPAIITICCLCQRCQAALDVWDRVPNHRMVAMAVGLVVTTVGLFSLVLRSQTSSGEQHHLSLVVRASVAAARKVAA